VVQDKVIPFGLGWPVAVTPWGCNHPCCSASRSSCCNCCSYSAATFSQASPWCSWRPGEAEEFRFRQVLENYLQRHLAHHPRPPSRWDGNIRAKATLGSERLGGARRFGLSGALQFHLRFAANLLDKSHPFLLVLQRIHGG